MSDISLDAGVITKRDVLVPLTPPLTTTVGTFFIGTFFGLLLYGLSVHQAYHYIHTFSKDVFYIKFLVFATMLLETVHGAFTVHVCYHYLVTHHSESVPLLRGVWSLNLVPLLSGLIFVVSQILFIRRVWLIGPRQHLIAGLVMTFLVVEVGFSMAATIETLSSNSFSAIQIENFLAGGVLGVAVIADTTLTVTLILAIRESHIGRNQITSDSMLDVLQLYVVNTGVLTGVFNLGAFIMGFARPKSFFLISCSIITTRLYSNTLLSVLNSRKNNNTMEIFVYNSSSTTVARPQREANLELWNAPRVRDPGPSKIKIAVTTEREGDGDISIKAV